MSGCQVVPSRRLSGSRGPSATSRPPKPQPISATSTSFTSARTLEASLLGACWSSELDRPSSDEINAG